jgi:hypothetical protein
MNNLHLIDIEMYGDKEYAREISKAVDKAIEEYVIENPPINNFTWNGTFSTEMIAVMIERRAKNRYIDTLEWTYIVDFIVEAGEYHEYHTALGLEEARGYSDRECEECGYNGQYWSIFDNDTVSYLHTARNSHNKHDCVMKVYEFINDGAEEPWDLDNTPMHELEETLESLYNYELVSHEKLIENCAHCKAEEEGLRKGLCQTCTERHT